MADIPGVWDAELDYRTRNVEWMRDAERYIPLATCVFDGSGATPTPDGRNVASITKNGTGDYTLTFVDAIPTDAFARVSLNALGVGHLHALVTASVRVKCFNISGTATDFTSVFVEVVRAGGN
jgi:hypothetical protein